MQHPTEEQKQTIDNLIMRGERQIPAVFVTLLLDEIDLLRANERTIAQARKEALEQVQEYIVLHEWDTSAGHRVYEHIDELLAKETP